MSQDSIEQAIGCHWRKRLLMLDKAGNLRNANRAADALHCYEEALSYSDTDALSIVAKAEMAETLFQNDCFLVDSDRLERLHGVASSVWSSFQSLSIFFRTFGEDVDEEVREWREKIPFFMAEAQYQSQHLEDAVWGFTQAIQESSTNMFAYCKRALSFAGLGRFDDALMDVEAAETLVRDSFGSLTKFSRGFVPVLPECRALVLSMRESPLPGRFMKDSYAEHVTVSKTNARNSGLVQWDSGGVVNERSVVLRENSFHLLMEEYLDLYRHSESRLSHRSIAVDLTQHRPRLDRLIEYYVQADESSFEVVSSPYSRELHCLRLSDAFKTFSFAADYQFTTIAEVAPQESTLKEISIDDDDVTIVCYHVIRSDDGLCSAIVRWVLVGELIVLLDEVACSGVLEDGKTLREVVSFLSSVAESPSMFREEQIRICCVLYDLLFRGVEEFIPQTTKHLSFVPDDILFRVPFSCLMDSSTGRYLIEDYSLSVSCSLWMMQKNAEQKKEVLLRSDSLRLQSLICESRTPIPVHDVDLPSWKRERASFGVEMSQVIRQHSCSSLPTVVLRGNSFGSFLFSSICSQFRPQTIHVVSHGSALDPANVRALSSTDVLYEFDMKGSLQCSTDCLLARTVAENLDLKGTDLVYLSCCSLGDGELTGGSILGFYRACFVAGCASVICYLWPVVSVISTGLSIFFYRSLGKAGDGSKAAALRSAVLSLLSKRIDGGNGGRLRDCPAIWASFQLFGNRN